MHTWIFVFMFTDCECKSFPLSIAKTKSSEEMNVRLDKISNVVIMNDVYTHLQ